MYGFFEFLVSISNGLFSGEKSVASIERLGEVEDNGTRTIS
jgi:hypothetical protein